MLGACARRLAYGFQTAIEQSAGEMAYQCLAQCQAISNGNFGSVYGAGALRIAAEYVRAVTVAMYLPSGDQNSSNVFMFSAPA